MPEPVMINGEEVIPFEIRGIAVLNTRQSAAFVGMTDAGFARKAQRAGLQKLRSNMRELETFYPLSQLQALKNEEPIQPLDVTVFSEEGSASPTSSVVVNIALTHEGKEYRGQARLYPDR